MNAFAPATATRKQTIAERLARATFSKWEIARMLFNSSMAGAIIVNGLPCYLQSILREDGSGRSFILSLNYGSEYFKCHVRTSD